MSWLIEVKNERSTEWSNAGLIRVRNLKGASGKDWGTVLGNYSDIPGVIQFEVVEISGARVKLKSKRLYPADNDHPLISEIGAWYEAENWLSGHYAVGDKFEVGWGYQIVSGEWVPLRSFGVIAPGASGDILQVRVTNKFTRTRVQTSVEWTDSLRAWKAKLLNGEWVSGASAAMYLQDSDNMQGKIDPDESCVFELQPILYTSASSVNNPVILEFTISSYEI